jgi:hypothetical protein
VLSAIAHGEVATAAQPHPDARPNAANAALAGQGAGDQPQQGISRPLCLLWRCRKLPGAAEGISGRGALLETHAGQAQSGGSNHMGSVPSY